MYCNLNQITKSFYIDELENFKNYANDILEIYHKNTEIKKNTLEQELLDKDNSSLDDIDKEYNYQEFQYKLSLNELQYYKIHSALYQLLFSIWENQVVDYLKSKTKTEKNNLINNYNEDIYELHILVNALKHGKGVSYNKLKNDYPKYFKDNFANIIQEYTLVKFLIFLKLILCPIAIK